MPIQEEGSFPRGKDHPTDKAKKSPKVLKRKRHSIDSSPITNIKKAKLVTENVKDISILTLPEGMVILGCVREVDRFRVKVNLPGRIIGYIPAANISEEYTAYLEEILRGEEKEPLGLKDMFKPGQPVVTKVEEISGGNEKPKVTLTLDPNKIQGDLSLSDIMKGFMLSASVQSIEDHGYIMNCGIPGARAFLKKSRAFNFEKLWNDGRPLGIGQILRCMVIKCTTSGGCSNVELNADPETITEVQVIESDVPQKPVILGMCFQLSVVKVNPVGLTVNITNNQTGYVHSNYLNVDKRKINKNALLQGRVLYIEPLTKNVFLTALENVCGPHLPPSPFESIPKGTKVKEAKVVSLKGGSVLLEFGKKSGVYGYAPFHQLDVEINDAQNESYSEIVGTRYPIGSFHECKVLEYDFMMQKFICTLKRNIINQKYSSLAEIAPGVVTSCLVENVTKKGVHLKVDAIHGTVEPIHCNDVPIQYFSKNFHRGQKVKAKVLNVKENLCEFTLKSALVHSQNPILTKFSDAEYDVQYEGVVVKITERGMVVKFYGDFTNFVPAKNVGSELDILKKYFIGQVVTCQVKKICHDEEKLVLTVQPFWTKKNGHEAKTPFKVGKPYALHVDEILPEGLIVRESATDLKGWIPSTQLTDCFQMATMLCQTYRKGDELFAYCLSCEDKVIFTLSPTFIKYFKSSSGKQLTKKGLFELEKNMVVPSTVNEVASDGLIVSVPMQREKCSVFIKSKDICDGKVTDVLSLGIQLHQTLMVCIKWISDIEIFGSCKLSSVCEEILMSENGITLLQHYMDSQKRIHNFWKNNGHPLGELEIGSHVIGTVSAVTDLGALINLDNGALAVLIPEHYGMNLEKDMRVEGTVMYIDVVRECVEITLWKHVGDMFSLIGTVPKHNRNKAKAYALISRPDLIVCSIRCLKSDVFSGYYICYVPSRWHINDLQPSPFFPVGFYGMTSVRICNDLLLAVPVKLERCERKMKLKREGSMLLKDGWMIGTNHVDSSTRESDSKSVELNSEDKKKKKKKKAEVLGESSESVKKGHSRDEIVESLNNTQPENMYECVRKELFTKDTNNKLKDPKKLRKKQTTVSRSVETRPLEPALDPDESTCLTELVEVNHCETIIKNKESEKNQKKKKENTSLKKSQNEEPQDKQSCLNVSAGFLWDATPDQLPVLIKQKAEIADSSSEDETEVATNKKKKQRFTVAEKRELARQEEERLRKIEERLMDAEKNPVSADDFDRLVMSAPNDSQNWIKYMAYHLEATEVGKAQAVAERALKTISFREEQEKLNVWMALLNLENLYGTQESLEKTIEEAVKLNDSYKVHMQLLNMYSMTRKLEELDKMVQLVTKKYKDQKVTWIEAGLACMKCGEIEKSRQLMQRALKVLDKRTHIEVLTRFALMENDWGESERAETIMENILTSYPKRCDIWNVYVDMLVKSKKIDAARQVLDRAVIQILPVGRMKSLFKKYLNFEYAHGTSDRVEKVREMAKNYVENLNR